MISPDLPFVNICKFILNLNNRVSHKDKLWKFYWDFKKWIIHSEKTKKLLGVGKKAHFGNLNQFNSGLFVLYLGFVSLSSIKVTFEYYLPLLEKIVKVILCLRLLILFLFEAHILETFSILIGIGILGRWDGTGKESAEAGNWFSIHANMHKHLYFPFFKR